MRKIIALLVLLCMAPAVSPSIARAGNMEWPALSGDKKGFVLRPSNKPFIPWGFNYDHDEAGRLIEDYWDREWPKVGQDFAEMKDLGANVVRIHLQFGRFMDGPDRPNEKSLDRLADLLHLAERAGLYLDLTGSFDQRSRKE